MKLTFEHGGTKLQMMKDGQVIERSVNAEDAISIISKSDVFDTGLLPPNTRAFVKSNNQLALVIEVPAGKHKIAIQHDHTDMNMRRMEIKDVPLPAAALFLKIGRTGSGTGFKLHTAYVYALKQGLLSLKDPLFLYPVPNVQEGQTICWGFDSKAATNYNYHSVASFEGAASMFLSAAFNDHCFTKSRLSKTFEWGGLSERVVEKYFEKLRDAGSFSDSWLVPANKTFEDALKIIAPK